MQFGHDLNNLLHEILLAYPKFGHVKLTEMDRNNGYYCVSLNIDNIPKLGVALPTRLGKEKLVALPLVFP